MIVIDTSGWIEYFTKGPLADQYEDYIDAPEFVITPTIVIYETFKKIKREKGEYEAVVALAKMVQTKTVPLDIDMAVKAADVSATTKLAMADAIIYATAQAHDSKVITSDEDFENLPDVLYLPKPKP